MSRFTVTAELDTVYEVQYVNVTHIYEDPDAEVKTETFATEDAARTWIRQNNVFVKGFARVTKLEI